MRAAIDEFAELGYDRGDDLINTIGSQMRASLAFAAAHPEVERLSRAVLAERGRPIFGAVVARFGFAADDPLGALIDHHAHHGEFRDDLSPEFARRIVLTVINNLPDLLDVDGPAELELRVDEVLSFLRNGLYGPTTQPDET